MSVAMVFKCSTVLSTTMRGMAPIVPLLKKTLSRASMNWARILVQYAGSPESGMGGVASCSFDAAAAAIGAAKADLRKLRRLDIVIGSLLELGPEDDPLTAQNGAADSGGKQQRAEYAGAQKCGPFAGAVCGGGD